MLSHGILSDVKTLLKYVFFFLQSYSNTELLSQKASEKHIVEKRKEIPSSFTLLSPPMQHKYYDGNMNYNIGNCFLPMY
jgi:hypothetical protein